MKIEISKTAGFCKGAKRAVRLVFDILKKSMNTIYTFGPLIHNPQVLDFLCKNKILFNKCILGANKTVVIRAHGVSLPVLAELRLKNDCLIDATCPRVIRVQSIIEKYIYKDHVVVIMGDDNHPEIKGLIGHSTSKVYIIKSVNNLNLLPIFRKAVLIAQTTYNKFLYEKIENLVCSKNLKYKLYNTICSSTIKRQIEVGYMSNRLGGLIIIGGKLSSNSKNLKNIANISSGLVLHIENESELYSSIKKMFLFGKIGLITGASTPNCLVRKTYATIRFLLTRSNISY